MGRSFLSTDFASEFCKASPKLLQDCLHTGYVASLALGLRFYLLHSGEEDLELGRDAGLALLGWLRCRMVACGGLGNLLQDDARQIFLQLTDSSLELLLDPLKCTFLKAQHLIHDDGEPSLTIVTWYSEVLFLP
jgi:hypothetical protein